MADDKKNSSSSLLASAVALAPVGIGLQRTLHRYQGSVPNVSLSSNRPFVKVHENVQGTIQRSYETLASNGLSPTNIASLDRLVGAMPAASELSLQDARMLWDEAARSGGVPVTALEEINGRIERATTTQQFFNDLTMALQARDSIYTQRASSIFAENLSALGPLAVGGNRITFGSIAARGSRFDQLSGRVVRKLSTPLALGDKVLAEQIQRLSASMGSNPALSVVSRKGLPGSTLTLTFQGGILPHGSRMRLRVPLPLADNPNVIVRGMTQQTRYLAGQYGVVEGNALKHSFNHAQWMLYRANEDLVPALLHSQQLTGRRANQLKNMFERSIHEPIEYVDSLIGSQHAGLSQYEALRSQVMRLYPSGPASLGKRGFEMPKIGNLEYQNIISGGLVGPNGPVPIWPGSGAIQMAHGTVMLADPRGGLIPEGASFSKGILKSLRKSAPSAEAVAAMERNELNQLFGWAREGQRVGAPMVRTLYVPDAYASDLSRLGMGTQGTMLISEDLWRQRRQTELVQKVIAADKALAVAPHLTGNQAHWANINQSLTAGTVLGQSPAGRPVVLGEDMTLLEATAFQDKNRGDYLRLMLQREVDDLGWSKVYGSAKAMAGPVSQERIRQVAQHFGANYAAQAVVYGGELKNRTLHYNQMFTALWDFARANMDSGKALNKMAANYVQDPVGMIAKLRAEALRDAGAHFSDDYMLSRLWRIGRYAGLSPEQMGLVFGAVPQMFGSDKLAERLVGDASETMLGNILAPTPQELAAINRGITVGVGQYFYGGKGGPGMGRRASIEPRLFETLSEPHWGTLGRNIQMDIAQRVINDRPELLVQQRQLLEAVKSMTDLKQIPGSVLPNAITDSMLQEGVNMSLPGMGDISIPGYGSLNQLAKYRTPAGTWVTPNLVGSYENFIDLARKYEGGRVTGDVIKSELSQLISDTGAAAVGTISGKGGLLRGKLPGSVFLTGVSAIQGSQRAMLGPMEVGVTPEAVKKMLRDMEGVYGADEMAEIRERLFATNAEGKVVPQYGESFVGLGKRDPVIGPYSIQPIRYKLMRGRGAYAIFNEAELPGYLSPGAIPEGQRAEIEALQRKALRGSKVAADELTARGFERLSGVRFSAMPGFAGDLDADDYAAMMVTPNTERQLARHMENMSNEYTVHSLRMQLLKSKAGKGVEGLTLQELMGEQALGAMIPQTNLGPLSISLQEARAAVTINAKQMGATGASNALTLLEWLEQTPISGKHIAPGHTAELIDTMGAIGDSVRTTNAELMYKSVQDVFRSGGANNAARTRLLTEGAEVTVYNKKLKQFTTHSIPGLELASTVSSVMDSVRSFRRLGEETGMNADRMREVLIGHQAPTAAEAKMLSSKGFEGLSDLAGFLNPVQERGAFAQMSERVLVARNKMAAAGKRFLSHAKPLALGFAASVALSNILSQPPLTVDREALAAPEPNLRSGSGGADLPANIHPGGEPANLPPPPSSLLPGSAYVTSDGRPMGAIVNVSGRSRGGLNHGDLNRSMGNRLGSADVRTSVRDDRRSLTPQRIADILKK